MIKKKLEELPKLPGVYLFKDQDNNIIYIGKAKSLKKRIISYFTKQHKDPRLCLLIKEVFDLEFIITKTEVEAFLLEAQLVRENQPKFNIQLKDGQPYIYFLITKSEKSSLSELKLVRNKKEKGEYFGPINRRWQARKAYDFILKNFKLKLCNRKAAKGGCLDFHLGFCAGPCLENFDQDAYLFRLSLTRTFLTEDYEGAKALLESKIFECNKSMQFEQSKHLTQYLNSFNYTVNALKTCFSENKFASSIAYAISAMSKEKFLPSDIGRQMSEFLEISIDIETIDCFDISHFQGQYMVGSCVRFLRGIPFKSKFRRFKIKTLNDQNDYAALQEIVSRRYKDSSEMPDLILIDGGKGQLSAVQKIISQVPIISLAKKEEKVFYYKYNDGLKLDLKSEVGKLLIAIRDYAHHFAINYHRLKRSKSLN